MSEYINREAVKWALRLWVSDCNADGDTEAADRFKECIDLIDSFPAADVVEVPQDS